MASVDFLDRLGRWSQSTRVTYAVGLKTFAACFQVGSPDVLVGRIQAGELDVYQALDKFVSQLVGQGLAPKTTRSYLAAVKGLLRHEGVALDDHKLRFKVGVPPNVEASLDRIPTREEVRLLLLNTNPRTRALIALLATSGLRIGEAANLHIGSLNLLKNTVNLMATRSKGRRNRITFITDEAAKFIRDYARDRMNSKDDWLFPDPQNPEKPAGKGALYMLINRALTKAGLRTKLDPDSRMYELHPHAFRKYFFTKLISAGVDRGVAEYVMGHRFGLDNSYLRMAEDRLRQEYMKAEADFTFLTQTKPDPGAQTEIAKLQRQIDQMNFALRMLQDKAGYNIILPPLQTTNHT